MQGDPATLPKEDLATVRRWARLHTSEEVDLIVGDSAVTVTGWSGAALARLVWREEAGTWRLLTPQRGDLRVDPLAEPTTEIEDLLSVVTIDSSERFLG